MLALIKRMAKRTVAEPFCYNEAVRQAYLGYSVAGGTLRGKTVMITGATGDIGHALTLRFLKEECTVVAAGRDAEKLAAMCRDIGQQEAYRSRLDSVLVDLTDKAQIEANVAELIARHKIDILINNAGRFTLKDRNGIFRGVTKAELQLSWDTNAAGAIELTERVLSKTRCKKVINISSICSEQRKFQYTIYGLTKNVINEYTKHLAAKYPDKIFVSLMPGSTITKMGGYKIGDTITNDCNRMHRPALPEEIAGVAAVFSSDIGDYLQAGGSMVTASACEMF